jgi:hypothetical protein
LPPSGGIDTRKCCSSPWTFRLVQASMMPVDEDDGPEPQPPKDLNLGLLLLLGGLFFLFVLLAGLVGLTP